MPASPRSLESRTYAKVTWRLIPLLFLCFALSYIDRLNIGFAKLQMLSDLKFSESVYGAGAGIFFIGYFLFEIPSNILLSRTGARLWISRIMVTWGIISCLMMFVNSVATFYALRFVLGIAEAGFFPGMILYLTYWYPSSRRAHIMALFMTAIPLSGVISGPMSGWIMASLAEVRGLHGWQWLFLLEGLPSILTGIVLYFYLDDTIRAARWLSEDEKRLLETRLASDTAQSDAHSLAQLLRSPRVWALSGLYFALIMGLYGISFWLPHLIAGTGVKNVFTVGLLMAIPYGAATVVMILVARNSDAKKERRWHIATFAGLGGAGFILSAMFSHNTPIAMMALTLATCGILSTLPVYWTLPTAYLSGTAAAAGIALINSIGALAGLVSPYMIGLIQDATHSTDMGLYILAGCLFLAAGLVLALIPAEDCGVGEGEMVGINAV